MTVSSMTNQSECQTLNMPHSHQRGCGGERIDVYCIYINIREDRCTSLSTSERINEVKERGNDESYRCTLCPRRHKNRYAPSRLPRIWGCLRGGCCSSCRSGASRGLWGPLCGSKEVKKPILHSVVTHCRLADFT
jgi:hypothetical protein